MMRSKDKQFKPEMSDIEDGLHSIAPSLLGSLPMGIVAFSSDLKVIHANDQAGQLLEIGEYMHRSLACGTEAKVWGDWKSSLVEVLETGHKATFDSVEYVRGDSVVHLKIVLTPLISHSTGKISGGLTIVEDTTRKDSVANELSHAERLAAIGKVAGKVAHELNNPMDGILRYINLSIRAIENQQFDKPVGYLNECRSGLMRMVQIIGELLEFSRGRYLAMEYSPIEDIVSEAVRAMESKCPGVTVEVFCEDLKIDTEFRGDNIFQVFCNLIKNAADAMDGIGSLKIKLSATGEEVAVEFKDDGTGISPDHADSIFEPFFTTKENGRGTGLGLAICKDIIEKYEGRIQAGNNPDGGSVFTVYLPLKA
jgi:two-component system NtrC family sensor kinase